MTSQKKVMQFARLFKVSPTPCPSLCSRVAHHTRPARLPLTSRFAFFLLFRTAQTAAAGTAGAVAAAATALSFSASADDAVHPPSLKWSHKGFFSGFDHASIRRGHQVYQEVRRSALVCRACRRPYCSTSPSIARAARCRAALPPRRAVRADGGSDRVALALPLRWIAFCIRH